MKKSTWVFSVELHNYKITPILKDTWAFNIAMRILFSPQTRHVPQGPCSVARCKKPFLILHENQFRVKCAKMNVNISKKRCVSYRLFELFLGLYFAQLANFFKASLPAAQFWFLRVNCQKRAVHAPVDCFKQFFVGLTQSGFLSWKSIFLLFYKSCKSTYYFCYDK